MTLNRLKLGRVVTFIKYIASVVSLIFRALALIWNKITFPASNTLNLAKLVVNEPMNNIYKKLLKDYITLQKSSSVYSFSNHELTVFEFWELK